MSSTRFVKQIFSESSIGKLCHELIDLRRWIKADFASPSPRFIKQAVLLRNGFPGATWVESGTYLGRTTSALSKNASQVFSIEPAPRLFDVARTKLSSFANVTLLNGVSEIELPKLLPSINGTVNFWLDGHYSEGETFRGNLETPIAAELDAITKNLTRFDAVCVMVDDIRLFSDRSESGYPSREFLIDWAEKNNLIWNVEHDIFIAKSIMLKNA